ncbi:DNA-3-methyladenine glycosylase [Chryseosolibacter indicus]|uniref:Putative 3-methyladenine DNA glycosylase n=1 Tax=Chryseosolibacter indicus TaxID=2782351 RepID=A0ABS5VK92_9BACT|nr:DNA-3-methyladenine glycosylase [Chryseosolibacter indicus]MBT1701848.1 DNA-3-methyladenine glycosylase [Chryseosolibacter indicus]
MKLPLDFYIKNNVVKIAKDLLGKVLYTNLDGVITGGLIVETEAYSWKEKGCHAYNNRKTNRNAIMFERGGYSYVYLCYGMHYLFNVVTNVEGVADAVLVRALEPLSGEQEMLLRRGKISNKLHLTSGPGKLSKALGIDRTLNGKSLLDNEIWIEDIGRKIAPKNVVIGPRIGIDYAGEDALLPWRFSIRGNPWVSK